MMAARPLELSDTTYETVHVLSSKKALTVVALRMPCSLPTFQSIDIHYINIYINVKPIKLSKAAMNAARILIDPEVLRGAAGKAVSALKVLANEDRLLLLCQLSQG